MRRTMWAGGLSWLAWEEVGGGKRGSQRGNPRGGPGRNSSTGRCDVDLSLSQHVHGLLVKKSSKTRIGASSQV